MHTAMLLHVGMFLQVICSTALSLYAAAVSTFACCVSTKGLRVTELYEQHDVLLCGRVRWQ